MPHSKPLIAHVVYHLAIGGLENGLVNLINHIPEDKFDHLIICINDYDADFAKRITRKDIRIIAIHKKPGRDWAALWNIYKILRLHRPDIIHTRNLAALDALVPAFIAGIKVRIHSEHGRDENDADGNNKKLQLLRKLHRPFVSHYIALSKDLENYLLKKINIPSKKLSQIYNGVDQSRFNKQSTPLPGCSISKDNKKIVIGTVGRLQAVKNQQFLINGFIHLLEKHPHYQDKLSLVLIGDGPDKEKLQTIVNQYPQFSIQLLGAQNDIPSLLNRMDIFVLPSLSEGISNTILESMASGLAVIATAVGGNVELIEKGVSGELIKSEDIEQLSTAIKRYVDDAELRHKHGCAAQERISKYYSIDAMVRNYVTIYQALLNQGMVDLH